MRAEFSKILESYSSHKNFIFMTGDLGFLAFETLQGLMGSRFINAGIAEQNMVSVAAGLAKSELKPWVYSIAPFIYARAFEQIRNDICFHNLPVVIVGNGGGYGYGVMGLSHHALEDYGILLTLPNLTAYIPAFREDLESIIPKLMKSLTPSYLRLGRCEKPPNYLIPTYAPVRKLLNGTNDVMVFCGPLVGDYLKIAVLLPEEQRPSVWVISEISHGQFNLEDKLWKELIEARRVVVVEEHVAEGGIGMKISWVAQKKGINLKSFSHFYALGYPSGLYGDQNFHRKESKIDGSTLNNFLKSEYEFI